MRRSDAVENDNTRPADVCVGDMVDRDEWKSRKKVTGPK